MMYHILFWVTLGESSLYWAEMHLSGTTLGASSPLRSRDVLAFSHMQFLQVFLFLFFSFFPPILFMFSFPPYFCVFARSLFTFIRLVADIHHWKELPYFYHLSCVCVCKSYGRNYGWYSKYQVSHKNSFFCILPFFNLIDVENFWKKKLRHEGPVVLIPWYL